MVTPSFTLLIIRQKSPHLSCPTSIIIHHQAWQKMLLTKNNPIHNNEILRSVNMCGGMGSSSESNCPSTVSFFKEFPCLFSFLLNGKGNTISNLFLRFLKQHIFKRKFTYYHWQLLGRIYFWNLLNELSYVLWEYENLYRSRFSIILKD